MNWISIKEQVPDDDRYVLCYRKGACSIHINWYSDTNERWMVGYKDVTHWMNLPELPEDQ